MRFVQTIWFSTDRFDAMQALMDRWAEEGGGGQAPGLIRTTVAKDRDHEGMYLVIAEFEDYEQAIGELSSPEPENRLRAATLLKGAAYPEAALPLAKAVLDAEDAVQFEAIAAELRPLLGTDKDRRW